MILFAKINNQHIIYSEYLIIFVLFAYIHLTYSIYQFHFFSYTL